jgi:CheY-like chemotaxis protein
MEKMKVAVIDDERDVVTYLIWALQDNGFDVCSATNANDGLEIIRSERPDLVCIDILMPRETGYSLYRKIREEDSLKDLPVIVITGLNMAHEDIQTVIGGNGADGDWKPDGYIEKPIKVPQFIEMVRKLVN